MKAIVDLFDNKKAMPRTCQESGKDRKKSKSAVGHSPPIDGRTLSRVFEPLLTVEHGIRVEFTNGLGVDPCYISLRKL